MDIEEMKDKMAFECIEKLDLESLEILIGLYQRYAFGTQGCDSNHISDFRGWITWKIERKHDIESEKKKV